MVSQKMIKNLDIKLMTFSLLVKQLYKVLKFFYWNRKKQNKFSKMSKINRTYLTCGPFKISRILAQSPILQRMNLIQLKLRQKFLHKICLGKDSEKEMKFWNEWTVKIKKPKRKNKEKTVCIEKLIQSLKVKELL